jgi:hydrogenase expression/formation protein HypC
MQINRVEGLSARCAIRGVEREISLFLIQDQEVQVGDFVLVHVGYAIQALEAEDAAASLELFDQMQAETEAETGA